MLTLDDPRWTQLEGGYRLPYDPTAALRQLDSGGHQAAVWDEFWKELHHQGDVGTASYAAIPTLVDIHRRMRELDWNLYALAATIEVERHRRSNPPIPDWLVADYEQAWRELVHLALEDLATTTDPSMLQSALAVVALGKGALKLGAFLSHLDGSELEELLEDALAWTALYRNGAA